MQYYQCENWSRLHWNFNAEFLRYSCENRSQLHGNLITKLLLSVRFNRQPHLRITAISSLPRRTFNGSKGINIGDVALLPKFSLDVTCPIKAMAQGNIHGISLYLPWKFIFSSVEFLFQCPLMGKYMIMIATTTGETPTIFCHIVCILSIYCQRFSSHARF